MKQKLRITVLYFIITGLQIPLIFGQPVEVDEKIRVHLKQFREDYSKSMMTGNPSLLQSYFSDSVRLMPPFQKTVLGRVNALQYFKSFTNRFTIHSYLRTELEIIDLGQQVLEIGEIKMQLILKSSKQEFDIAAKYLNLWIKSESGELKLLTEGWNVDQFYADLHDHLRFEDVPSRHIALEPNVRVTNDIQFELAALNHLLDATITEHDGKMWSLYYADDAKLMANYYPINNGKMKIDEYIQTHIKELPTFQELEIRNDRIDDLGIYIIEYASHIASWKNGDHSGVGLGKNIRIWRREPNHTLKLFRTISMYD